MPLERSRCLRRWEDVAEDLRVALALRRPARLQQALRRRQRRRPGRALPWQVRVLRAVLLLVQEQAVVGRLAAAGGCSQDPGRTR